MIPGIRYLKCRTDPAMALYTARNPETVDAYQLPDTSFVIIKDGKASTPIPQAEFEGKYIPFVKG
jgi:hypothetical protein